ncbi:Tex family protein [Pullulanibacillus sp. KACC 23026]|uniref:Tex family protein n=1 Tax=Pullulanibacillus sp. KACC 23026 TaxID=3028315 RepID=UPI0023B171B1|nr:Tex family protein [Pullulanibacillus sp. KACC 23026]WEG12519.1 Tex family protein [Pullulanibacillus sp. KACC 23026]
MTVEKENQEQFIQDLVKELHFRKDQIQNVIHLIEEDNTIPFIARYRKEMTGGLDEVQINTIYEKWHYAVQLHKRKEEVIRLIEEQGKLTADLSEKIMIATRLQEVEDLYRPYKQKRRTRATAAKEKGLELLADWIRTFPASALETEAAKYISEEKEVLTAEDALQGASDIIAEQIADDADSRKWIRELTINDGILLTEKKKNAEDEKEVYGMYYEYQEKVKNIVPHRTLAINRGEKEDVLKVSIEAPEEEILRRLGRRFIKNQDVPAAELMKVTIQDAYKRLIAPSIEREVRQLLSEKADEQAIHIFSENLSHLLMQPPMRGAVVLGVDPAYRTGCKLAVVDETGKVLAIDVIYPTPPKSDIDGAKKKVKALIEKYEIEMIAIGNGTASRETEQFIADTIKEVEDRNLHYLIVNEAGASVYSASALAREEFPDFQVEQRSAVSIARRLQDPLAELVKIDPKSVGVGQYQHDVSQKALSDSLTFVVETAVNRVGVNVNTASPSLLQYVSGLSKSVAQNIVKMREEKGKFQSRDALLKVPRLGAKAYEQCAGFLRILDGKHPLDRTPIHPESYETTEKLLNRAGLKLADIGTEAVKEKLQTLDIQEEAEALNVGEMTLKDIIDSLIRPGRDPRDDIAKPLLRTDVLDLNDLKPGMKLEGTVRNVVDFGAFVDIGVKQDGLVHISKLANRYVKHPLDVVHVGQIVTVWVDQVDVNKGRIALSMLPLTEKVSV